MGVDVAEISRIEAAITRRPRFVQRIYTEAEASYCQRMRRPYRRFATRFAGKEAVLKSLGLGARGINWTDIEILGRGKPEVRLSGRVAERAGKLGVTRIEISLTHGEDLAIAVAVAINQVATNQDVTTQ